MKTLRYNLGNYIVPEECRGGIAIDVGCNNGCFTEKYKDFFSSILAVEPNIELYNLLTEKYKEHHHIRILNNAASSTDNEKLQLCKYEFNNEDGSYATYKPHTDNFWKKENTICECTTISLESIYKTHPDMDIDYMKIDCECGEYDFLLNKDLKNIKYIGLELHAQLGQERSRQLFEYICETHKTAIQYTYNANQNKEYLFTRI